MMGWETLYIQQKALNFTEGTEGEGEEGEGARAGHKSRGRPAPTSSFVLLPLSSSKAICVACLAGEFFPPKPKPEKENQRPFIAPTTRTEGGTAAESGGGEGDVLAQT